MSKNEPCRCWSIGASGNKYLNLGGGHVVPEDVNFCPYCGANITETPKTLAQILGEVAYETGRRLHSDYCLTAVQSAALADAAIAWFKERVEKVDISSILYYKWSSQITSKAAGDEIKSALLSALGEGEGK